MTLDLSQDQLIFLAIHGSNAYGTAVEGSDIDIKGVVIPPQRRRDHLFEPFEQAENSSEVLLDPHIIKTQLATGITKVESTIFSLKKFLQLAYKASPNIIELLFVQPLIAKYPWRVIMNNSGLFISDKLNHTYQGMIMNHVDKLDKADEKSGDKFFKAWAHVLRLQNDWPTLITIDAEFNALKVPVKETILDDSKPTGQT